MSGGQVIVDMTGLKREGCGDSAKRLIWVRARLRVRNVTSHYSFSRLNYPKQRIGCPVMSAEGSQSHGPFYKHNVPHLVLLGGVVG